MASASKLIAVLIFWGILGISWALLNEQLITKIPTMFPEPITQDLETWTILQFIWKISIIGLAYGSAVSILGDKGVKGIIASGVMIFAGMFMLIFLWAAFWNVCNVTIPHAFAQGWNTATNEKQNLGVYDASFEICMIGLALISLLLGGTTRIGRTREHYRTIRPNTPGIKLEKRKREKITFKNVGGSTAVYKDKEFEGFRYE